MKRSGVVIFIAIVLLGLTVADTFTPVMITTLFRHGSRAPVSNDLNLTWAYQVGAGNLTGVGMRQHYLLGRQIKKNYADLFDYSKFTNYDYFLRSSPTWRTIQSTLSHMSGIYQSGTEIDSGFGLNITNQLKDNIEPNFSPIDFTFDQNKALPYGFGVFPVITANTNMDFLFKLDESCPNLAKIKETGRKDKVKHYEDVPSDLYDMLDKIGLKPSQFRGDDSQGWDLDSTDAAADSLSADLYYSGKSYPGTNDDFYKKLFLAASIHFALNYPTDEIQRLWTDGISRAIIEGMDSKINGTVSHKLRMFSGHDSNVMPFMMKYGLTNEICLKEVYQNGHTSGTCELKPSFASSFIWELVQRDSDKSYFARVLFNGKPVKVCGNNVADFYCPYADFKNMMKDKLYSKTFMDTCGSLYYRLSSWRTTLIVLLVGLSLAALASLVLVFMYFKVYYRTKSEIAEAEQSYSDNKITTA